MGKSLLDKVDSFLSELIPISNEEFSKPTLPLNNIFRQNKRNDEQQFVDSVECETIDYSDNHQIVAIQNEPMPEQREKPVSPTRVQSEVTGIVMNQMNIRNSIVMSEILAKPVALRNNRKR